MKLRMNGAPRFLHPMGYPIVEGSKEGEGGRVLLLGWGVAGMLRLKLRTVPFWNRGKGFQHEDSDPPSASWLPVFGSRCSARTGLLRGLSGVPDGDPGLGGRGWSGAICAVALAIIP